MKIKLDAKGALLVERRGDLNPQYCPFAPNREDGSAIECGDWCPKLREPEYNFDEDKEGYLYICNGDIITFDECIDERTTDEN